MGETVLDLSQSALMSRNLLVRTASEDEWMVPGKALEEGRASRNIYFRICNILD